MYAEEEEEEEEGDACGGGEAHSPMTWQPPSPMSTSHTYKTYLPSLEVEEGSEVFPRLRATTKFKKDQDSRRECGGTTLTTLTTGTTVTSGFVGAGRGNDGGQGEREGVVERERAEVLQDRELREEVQNLRIQLKNKCVMRLFFFYLLSFGGGIDLVFGTDL